MNNRYREPAALQLLLLLVACAAVVGGLLKEQTEFDVIVEKQLSF